MKRKINLIKASLLIFPLMLILLIFYSNDSLKIWGYDFELVYKNEGTYFMEYDNTNERIRLNKMTDIDEAFSRELVSDKVTQFKSLFEVQRTGYPGQYTRYIECPEEFKPKFFEEEFNEGFFQYFIGYANSNYAAGACAEDLIKFKSIYGFLYCNSKKTLIEIQYFLAMNQSEQITKFLEKISCEI